MWDPCYFDSLPDSENGPECWMVLSVHQPGWKRENNYVVAVDFCVNQSPFIFDFYCVSMSTIAISDLFYLPHSYKCIMVRFIADKLHCWPTALINLAIFLVNILFMKNSSNNNVVFFNLQLTLPISSSADWHLWLCATCLNFSFCPGCSTTRSVASILSSH